MPKVQVVVDSVASIPQRLVDEFDLKVASLWVIEDGKSTRELEMDVHEFYRRIGDMKEIPTSSQPTVEEFAAIFEDAARAGRDVLCVPIASAMSGTFQSATLAGRQVAERFPQWSHEIVDSMCNSMQTGFIALAGARKALAGSPLAECAQASRDTIDRTRFVFTPEGLEYLRKGGRIGNAAALVGSLLQVKPVLNVENAVVETLAKVRTTKKALEEVLRVFLADVQRCGLVDAYVHYIGQPEAAREFSRDVLGPAIGRTIEVVPVSPVVGVHVGPAIGIVYETERPLW